MTVLTMSANAFTDLASANAFASSDKAGHLLTGVLLDFKTDGTVTNVMAIANDRYKLVTIEREAISASADAGSMLIPGDTLAKAAKDAAKTGDEVTITVEDNLTFTIGNANEDWRYGGRLVDGKYPDVLSLIPKSGTLHEVDGGIAFNAFFLADFIKVAPWCGVKGRNKSGDDATIRITAINDNRRPIRLESWDRRTTIVIMPVANR